MRPLCKACAQRPRAVNYHKLERTYFRTLCEICIAHGAGAHVPRWQRAGYKPKNACDKCGYKSPHAEVFRVFHIDENLNNCRHSNLKTVCLNCAAVLGKDGMMWRQGDLIADF